MVNALNPFGGFDAFAEVGTKQKWGNLFVRGDGSNRGATVTAGYKYEW